MKHLPKLFLFYCILVCSSLAAQTAPHRPGEFLVSLPEGQDAAVLTSRMPGLTAVEKVSNFLNISLLRSDMPEPEVLAWLRRQPEVRSAQFNHLLENRTLPNDPFFPQQWHLRNDGSLGGVFDADLDAEQAWEISTGGITPAGDTIVIAVIDGGLDAAHPDLSPNLWHNWADIPNNNLDDDGNGYTDDFRGWNVATESDGIEGISTAHGTPVSAILGARGNNEIGVTGVNWNTKIMFVAASGTEAKILAAYDYVYQSRQRYNSTWGATGAFVVAVNCSWGINYGQPSEAPLWCEAFDKLGAVGIVSVAATVNLPVDVDIVGDLPTACPSNYLISVTSLNSSDEKAGSAGWGATHVDLGAYGQEVFTAASNNAYGHFTGTSFAAPQVAGVVGLLYAAPCPNLIALAKTDPASAAYWAKSLILENVTPNPSLDGISFSDGRLNLYKTLQSFQNQCSNCPAPFALKTEILTDSSVLLLWSKTAAAHSVNLRWRILGIGSWHTLLAVPDTFLLQNLFACTSYEFEMQSLCEGGVVSAWSPPFIFKSKGCCTAPASVWLENSSEEYAKIAWEATSFNEKYRLRLREAGNNPWTFFEADTSVWAFQNLNPCTDYEVQVQARCEEWLTDYSSPLLFQTKGCGSCNEVPYCAVMGGSALQEWVELVQIGSWAHHSGSGGYGYQNFAATQPVFPQLVSQTAVPVSVTPGFSGNTTKEYFRIYVDFNQDGDFEDDDELAFDPGFALEGAAEGFLQVPEFAAPGITRLRVMMKYTSTNGNPPTPCTNFEFGQVEDYCVELLSDSISTAIPVEDTIWLLRTYPQPARDWVILEFTEGVSCGDCELLVQDMTGRTVMASVDPVQRNGKVYLDISDWPVGMYALKARFGSSVLRGKLLKV
jgi:serine protease